MSLNDLRARHTKRARNRQRVINLFLIASILLLLWVF